jgi:hypothetical protein
MSCRYDTGDLEAFDAGRLSADENAEMAAHVATCPTCKDELSWLLREQRLMAARAARSADQERTDAIWSGVAGRVGKQPERRTPPAESRVPLIAAGLAAAAVVALAVFASYGPHHGDQGPVVTSVPPAPAPVTVNDDGEDDKENDAEVRAALAQAERDYAAAASSLERRYRKQRAALDPQEAERADALLSRGRPVLKNASAGDVEMRQVMLATHADYVHALHTLVGGMEDVP